MSVSAVASSQSTITLSDCTCMICFEVFVEPIELPCKHELCRSCFDDLSTSALIKFECPTCSRPLTDWYAAHKRIANNSNSSASLVNKERWLLIQRCFRDEVELRLGGRSAQVIADSIKNYNDHGIIDSVYARSVMSDFDLYMSEHRDTTDKPSKQQPASPQAGDKFDIHEFLRKEKEEEERESEKVVAELLKQDGLTVNDYAQMYDNRYMGPSVVTPKKVKSKAKTPAKRVSPSVTPVKTSKTQKPRSSVKSRATAAAEAIPLPPSMTAVSTATIAQPISSQSSRILASLSSSVTSLNSNPDDTLPSLDAIINQVATGHVAGRVSSSSSTTSGAAASNTTDENRPSGKRASKRKLEDIATSVMIPYPANHTSSSTSSSSSSTTTIITRVSGNCSTSVHIESDKSTNQKRVKISTSSN